MRYCRSKQNQDSKLIHNLCLYKWERRGKKPRCLLCHSLVNATSAACNAMHRSTSNVLFSPLHYTHYTSATQPATQSALPSTLPCLPFAQLCFLLSAAFCRFNPAARQSSSKALTLACLLAFRSRKASLIEINIIDPTCCSRFVNK